MGATSKTFHGGLERVDGINLRHDDAGAETTQRVRGAFADVPVAADDSDFCPRP